MAPLPGRPAARAATHIKLDDLVADAPELARRTNPTIEEHSRTLYWADDEGERLVLSSAASGSDTSACAA